MVSYTGYSGIPDEPVKEFVIMPSGDIVVRLFGGESLWFDKNGKHPKSDLIGWQSLPAKEESFTRLEIHKCIEHIINHFHSGLKPKNLNKIVDTYLNKLKK